MSAEHASVPVLTFHSISADPGLSPEEDARRILTRVAADLAKVIREHPAQWFNFYRFWSNGALP